VPEYHQKDAYPLGYVYISVSIFRVYVIRCHPRLLRRFRRLCPYYVTP
jgi:hypothetical protein